MSVPQQPRKRCFNAYSLRIKGSTPQSDLLFGSTGQNVTHFGWANTNIDKQSNRQITEENSSGTILKHVKSVESVLCDKHKFSSYVSN